MLLGRFVNESAIVNFFLPFFSCDHLLEVNFFAILTSEQSTGHNIACIVHFRYV